MKLDSLIHFHRRAAGLSQVELAALAGVSRKVVQTLEGGGEQVNWASVQAVLKVLNVTLEPTGPLVERWKRSEMENPGANES